MPDLTIIEQQILNIIQADFPLTHRPYQSIAERIGTTEAHVLETVRALKANNLVRQISATLNGAFLGFDTALVSFRVEEAELEAAAQVVSKHPGVSHNYQRDHLYNLWFTLSVPQALQIEHHIQTLARLASCLQYLYLPGLKTYKRRVQFTFDAVPTTSTAADHASASHVTSDVSALDDGMQQELMQTLQQDLPVSPTPFADIADQFQIREEQLFEFMAYLQTSQKMNRFAGIVRHRNVGFTANAMVVWRIPADTVDAFGLYASEKREISHCYERVVYPEWPYNLYTMIHGTSHEVTHHIINELAEQFSAHDYQILYSGKEFKKQRVNYFDQAIAEWHRTFVEQGLS